MEQRSRSFIQTVYDKIKEFDEIIVDTETDSADPHKASILGMSFCFPDGEAYYIAKDDIDQEKIKLLTTKKIIGHNIKYDLIVLAKNFGVLFNAYFDTFLAEYLINPSGDMKDRKLEVLVKKYWGVDKVDLVGVFSKSCGKGYTHLPDNFIQRLKDDDKYEVYTSLLSEYAKEDAFYTWKLYNYLKKTIEARGYSSVYYGVEIPLLNILSRTELKGVELNSSELHHISSSLSSSKEATLSKLKLFYPEVNFNSPKQLADLLYNKLKLPKGKRTKSGFSTDVSELKRLSNHHAIPKLLLELRSTEKLLSSFVEPLIETLPTVHTQYNQARTITSRLSSDSPNLQNIPARGEYGSRLRKCFVARKGQVLVTVDYCLHPRTKILKSDMSWVNAEDVKIGDSLVGFDEDPKINRRKGSLYKKTKVNLVKSVKAKTFRIITEHGEVTSSADHRWLVMRKLKSGGDPQRIWVRTEDLSRQDRLIRFSDVWDIEKSEEAGYLAGFFDGEGWVSFPNVGFGQKEGVVLEKVKRLLRERGFELQENVNKTTDVHNVLIKGKANKEHLKFLGSIRPTRLLEKSSILWENRRTWSSRSVSSKILRIEYAGVQKVIAVGTTEKTLIANGFLSHNCQVELRILAHLADEKNLKQAFNDGISPHDETAKRLNCSKHIAKIINFSLLYGKNPESIGGMLGVSKEEGLKFVESYFNAYPGIKTWIEWQKAEARRKGGVYLIDGRFIPIPSLASTNKWERFSGERIAINYPIQGASACIVKKAMVNIYQDYNLFPLLQVHDELVYEVPERDQKIVDSIVVQMKTAWQLSVPLDVEYKVDRFWVK